MINKPKNMNEQGKATLENTVSNDVLNPLKVEFTPIEKSKQNGLRSPRSNRRAVNNLNQVYVILALVSSILYGVSDPFIDFPWHFYPFHICLLMYFCRNRNK